MICGADQISTICLLAGIILLKRRDPACNAEIKVLNRMDENADDSMTCRILTFVRKSMLLRAISHS
jgi:hypothetical protein